MNIIGAALGSYEITVNSLEADCLVGHSFGTPTESGSVNHALAEQILLQSDERPVIVDRTLADAFPERDIMVDYIVEGPISNTTGTQGGTWQTLLGARDFMKQEGLSVALMFAQANHIGRVLMQAEKLGIDYVVPENLPRNFDAHSEQWWTRSKSLWVPREVIGSLVLKAQKKL